MSPDIIQLPSLPSSAPTNGGGSQTLREEIIKGLRGTEQDIIPGEEEEDKQWKYRRSIPTMVLYDEKGLRSVRPRVGRVHVDVIPGIPETRS